ncbi:copper homeostasis protein CutC [Bombilactobacillus folatiphilus]|uniref:PF03932 family protein CutC n=1 Tax=Bombilactobacillus folatiphilus TaxID=2923362 RepID=A0ABY4PB46_9LACO|nr:copper homeostasis protein CutC [Bombilactobacillus folatiphilus]UQS82756.1 copper homeostasis protein CutC [Bombilactobacillus folatiphilus]
MILEACVGEFNQVPKAIARGANRLELNADLAQGGITPSLGVIQATVQYAHHHHTPVIVMLRPRGRNFIYNTTEIEIMRNDAKLIAQSGADGVAVGILTSGKQINYDALLYVLKDLPLERVFHMAFDEIKNQEQAINWLIKHKFQRILTHGGPLDQPLNIKHLQELTCIAQQQITILPGGGITKNNVNDIAQLLGLKEAHGTKIV